MPRHSMVNNKKVYFTAEEEVARDAEELAWANAKPMELWKESMQGTDDGMPRYLEDLITDNPTFTINEYTQTKYDDKVALRATKP